MTDKIEASEAQAIIAMLDIHPLTEPNTKRAQAFVRKRAQQIAELEAMKNAAYWERNQLVALLSKIYPAWIERHPETDIAWEDDWRNVVFIETSQGQASWHIHDSELENFAHLERREGRSWDGHTTEEKYKRLAAIKPVTALNRSTSEAGHSGC
jgi:HrpA-like RNA helicase